MMGEVSATSPPQHADVREMAVHAVVLVKPPGFSSASTIRATGILSTASVPPLTLPCIEASTAARRVGLPPLAKWYDSPKPPPGVPICPEHGGRGDDHPVFLLTILLALHPHPAISMVVFW